MSGEYFNVGTTLPVHHNMGLDRNVASEDEAPVKPGDESAGVSPAIARRRVLGNLGAGQAASINLAVPQHRPVWSKDERDEQTRRFPVLNVLDRPVSNAILKSFIPVESLEVPAFFGPCDGRVKTHYDSDANPCFREPIGTIRQKYAPPSGTKDERERIKAFLQQMAENGPIDDHKAFTRQDFKAVIGRLQDMLREPHGVAKVKAKLYELAHVQNFKLPGPATKKCDGSLIDWEKIARVEKFLVEASAKIQTELKKQFPWSYRDMIIYASDMTDATPNGGITGYVKRSHATRLWIPTWYRFDALRSDDGKIASVTVGDRVTGLNTM